MGLNIIRLKKMSPILLVVAISLYLANGEDTTTLYFDNYSSNTFTSTDVYNSSEEYTTEADCNDTSCASTVFTQMPVSNTTTLPKIAFLAHHDEQGGVCQCDLHRNVCDVNCCCDRDCTYEEKAIFDHCELFDDEHIDGRLCRYLHHEYLNFTMREWEIQNNDFMCVLRKNEPASKSVQKDDPFENYFDATREKDSTYYWPEKVFETEEYINYTRPYVQGLPLLFVSGNSTIDVLRVSEAFISNGCNILTRVRYLYDIRQECVQQISADNQYLDVGNYSEILFIARPEMFNYTKLRGKFMTCSSPICLKAVLNICSDLNLMDCKRNNDSITSLQCSTQDKTCVNVVKSLKYTIYHSTKGIVRVELSVHLKNLTRKSEKQLEMDQVIMVEFQWDDRRRNFSNILSGNPGYLVKSPILIGALINGSIMRDAESYLENFMVLPFEDGGVCELGIYRFQQIEFGYNTMLLCKIRATISAEKNMNATNMCRNIQMDIFKYWNIREVGGDFLNITFGQFGNANSSYREDWREMLYENSPKDVMKSIMGYFTNRNRTVLCDGLITGIIIDIYHARIDLKKSLNQEKILGITHQFEMFDNRNVSFKIDQLKINYDLDLVMKVSFWDVTSQKSRKLIDPPSLNIKLPSDFFYPFVKVHNGSCKNSSLFPVLFLILIAIFFVIKF